MDDESSSAANEKSGIPQCCCGRPNCAFLAHSWKLLDELERDARTAGELGQALLVRHESYVADSEQDRRHILETVESLEQEKLDLECRNARQIEENRRLLDQLECLNAAVAESDSKVLSLTDALRSADLQIERLTGLTARTELLQTQLARFEEEQAALQDTLSITKEDERTAILRWQRAERTIVDLQDQIDRIECDAREERERHVEVLGRMERRRAVEMELQTAAGRLKGAAAARTLPQDRNGSNVVSHFVKDILQDNANLQLGIVELKEMLDRSNEEVDKLRQLMGQQGSPTSPQRPSGPNLGQELGAKEVHVHHHYHAPARTVAESSRAPRRELQRRPRKKRTSLSSGHFLPPSASHTPKSSISSIHSPGPSSTASAILSQTSVTIPQQRRHGQRWSLQSNQTGFTSASSVPSSPYTESVFDRVFSDIATDISRPTSPESNGTLSPYAPPSDALSHPRHKLIPPLSLDAGMRSSSEGSLPPSQKSGTESRSTGKGKARIASPSLEYESWQAGYHSIILEENEDCDSARPVEHAFEDEDNSGEDQSSPQVIVPRLRRAASHESLISISGMDIHTLQSRPSQLLAGGRGLSSSSTATTEPVLSGTSAMALQSPGARYSDSRSYLSGIAASQRIPNLNKKTSMGNIGQKVGGWVWSRWGAAPTTSNTPSLFSAETDSIDSGTRSIESAPLKSDIADELSKSPSMAVKTRPPGINQRGPILGFGPEPKLPKAVITTNLDEEALRESLGTG